MQEKKSEQSSFFMLFLWIFAIALFIISSMIEQQLFPENSHNKATNGIVALEFAGSYNKLKTLIDSWNPTGTAWAAFLLGFDFLQIAAYCSVLFLTCQSVARKLQAQRLQTTAFIGRIMAVAVLLAGVCDITENIMLIQSLADYATQLSAAAIQSRIDDQLSLASVAALAKFMIIIIVLLFIALAYFLIPLTISYRKRKQQCLTNTSLRTLDCRLIRSINYRRSDDGTDPTCDRRE